MWTRNGLWPWRPALLPDETFSSWFARVAAGNGLSPPELYRVVKPGANFRPRDLDRFVEPDVQAILAERTGIEDEVIRHAAFTRWAGVVFENDDRRNKIDWLPLAGTEDSKRSFGQQFCPACLREDEVPYLRLTWRLGFVTACDKHRRLLSDRCQCGEPVHVLRTMPERDIRCWNCRLDLARVSDGAEVSPDDLDRQRWLLGIAIAGWTSLGTYGPVYSFVYFRILMLVFRLLATGRFADLLRAWVGDRLGNAAPTAPRILQVELLNPRSRHELLGLALHLMEDWPHRFVDACRATGISTRHLVRTRLRHPFAFADAVDWHLSEPRRLVTAGELQAGIAYLREKNHAPTYRALTDLFGVRLTAHKSLAEPARHQAPHGHGRYWKLDGVSSDVKLAAREAAIQSGESLGAWMENALRNALEITRTVTTFT